MNNYEVLNFLGHSGYKTKIDYSEQLNKKGELVGHNCSLIISHDGLEDPLYDYTVSESTERPLATIKKKLDERSFRTFLENCIHSSMGTRMMEEGFVESEEETDGSTED